jgi:hypothetical protein
VQLQRVAVPQRQLLPPFSITPHGLGRIMTRLEFISNLMGFDVTLATDFCMCNIMVQKPARPKVDVSPERRRLS